MVGVGMTFDVNFISQARTELSEHVKPCDEFEYAVVAALGEISWDEAVAAISKHRAPPTVGASHDP